MIAGRRRGSVPSVVCSASAVGDSIMLIDATHRPPRSTVPMRSPTLLERDRAPAAAWTAHEALRAAAGGAAHVAGRAAAAAAAGIAADAAVGAERAGAAGLA